MSLNYLWCYGLEKLLLLNLLSNEDFLWARLPDCFLAPGCNCTVLGAEVTGAVEEFKLGY